MRVLLVSPDIFDGVGGGQRFFTSMVQANPGIRFCSLYSGTSAPRNIPSNCELIQVTDIYRKRHGSIDLNRVAAQFPQLSLAGKTYDVAQVLDIAASVAQEHFDYVEIPDYLPFGVLVPEALRYHGVTFDRVVLSMHGTLSMGIRDNWSDDVGDLTSLTTYERLLYQYADIRYGIGRDYVNHWAKTEHAPAHLLGIQNVYRALFEDLGRRVNRSGREGGPPDLCFIGRQEKWKGPDLFLELCSRLPRKAFGQVRFFGPSVNLGNCRSDEALGRLAHNRNLDIHHETVAPSVMMNRLSGDRMVVFTPSRRDTFNLVALESLLSGCPTIVSTKCGVCDFLDTALPGLPYGRLDPDNLFGTYHEILDIIQNYDGARRRLVEYLESAQAQPYGMTLQQVYQMPALPGRAARESVRQVFGLIARALEERMLPEAEKELAVEAAKRFDVVIGNHSKSLRDPSIASGQFLRSTALRRLHDSISSGGTPGLMRRKMASSLKLLETTCFHGDRVKAYRLLAGWEKERGNDLLYATYWLRVMRLAGHIPADVLAEVQRILREHGLTEECTAAGLLYHDDEQAVFDYLHAQRAAWPAAPEGGLAEVVDLRRADDTPDVTVIVSVYNGADKIDTFVSGLERFTDESKRISEVIFVDSNSQDGTRDVLVARLAEATARGLSALYVRSVDRETIQRAWNRGIALSRGKYLAFLGLDEMDRPDSLALMARFLDSNPDVDWVQGSAVITEVNASGSYVRDVMAYNRMFDTQDMHYLECCYISYVGALYRKSIHDRVGFYDDRFRGAGDTEFKNRALPFIRAHTLPETLGTFLNYPEERTTQSSRVEMEDLRAWYLHRTPGGIRYAFERRSDADVVRMFFRALHYRKSYMDIVCTDVEYALAIVAYLSKYRPKAFAQIEQHIPNTVGLLIAYRRFDQLSPQMHPGLNGLHLLGGELEHVWFAISQAERVHSMLGLPADYRITNDNRWHQHHTLWSSKPQKFTAEEPVGFGDLAGAQDLGEVLSSCRSEHMAVDIDRAMATGQTGQLHRLFRLDHIDVVICQSARAQAPVVEGFLRDCFAVHLRGAGVNALVCGVGPDELPVTGEPLLFATGKVADVRPAVAAARVLVLPAFDPHHAELLLEDFVQALAYGKPVVASTALAAHFAGICPEVALSGIPTARNAAEMAARIRELLGDNAARQRCATAGLEIAERLRAAGRVQGTAAGERPSDGLLVEWRPEIASFNRLMWRWANGEGFEPGHVEVVSQAMRDPRMVPVLRAMYARYFTECTAPILAASDFRQHVIMKFTAEPRTLLDFQRAISGRYVREAAPALEFQALRRISGEQGRCDLGLPWFAALAGATSPADLVPLRDPDAQHVRRLSGERAVHALVCLPDDEDEAAAGARWFVDEVLAGPLREADLCVVMIGAPVVAVPSAIVPRVYFADRGAALEGLLSAAMVAVVPPCRATDTPARILVPFAKPLVVDRAAVAAFGLTNAEEGLLVVDGASSCADVILELLRSPAVRTSAAGRAARLLGGAAPWLNMPPSASRRWIQDLLAGVATGSAPACEWNDTTAGLSRQVCALRVPRHVAPDVLDQHLSRLDAMGLRDIWDEMYGAAVHNGWATPTRADAAFGPLPPSEDGVPLIVVPSDAATGHIDGIDGPMVSGWAWDPLQPWGNVEVDVLVGGDVVASGCADLQRDDIFIAGIGHGHYAFRIDIGSKSTTTVRIGRHHGIVTARLKNGKELILPRETVPAL